MPARSGFRFRPPPGEVSPPLAATLRLAFGPMPPMPPASSSTADPERIWELAGRLGIREALASREALWPDSGPAAALKDRLRQWRRLTVAADLRHEAAAREVAAVAAEGSIAIVWLKGFALRQLGIHAAGERALQDLDLLTSADGADALHRRLRRLGWRPEAGRGNEHHLPALERPRGGFVDLHFRLRGVRLGGSRSADLQQVMAAAGTRPAPGLPGTSVLAPDLLAAHLLAHAVGQHGHRPATYPLLRAVHDLGRLLPSASDWRRFAAGPFAAIAASVSSSELEAFSDLARALADGVLPDPETQPLASRLLRHAQVGATDPGYRRSLRRRHLAERLREALDEGHLGAYLRRKLPRFRLR